MIAHQRRHQQVRQPHRAGRAEHVKAVGGDRRLAAALLAAPFGKETVEPDRIDHRAGEDMGADLGALLDHDDGGFRRELLEPDRGGKPGRPGADDDHVELHRLAGGKFRCIHGLLRSPRRHAVFHAFIPRIDSKTIVHKFQLRP